MESIIPNANFGVPAFLTKLKLLVDDESTNDLIYWDSSGRTFHIRDGNRLAKEVLPLFFKHNNLSSFIRQLNMYGFRKINRSDAFFGCSEDMEFSHQYFLQGNDSLLSKIRRKPNNFNFSNNLFTSHAISGIPTVTSTFLNQHRPNHVVLDNEFNKLEDLVKQLRSRQESTTHQMHVLRSENQLLYREMTHLRNQLEQQSQLIKTLFNFLSAVASEGMTSNIRISAFKRKLALPDASGNDPNTSEVIYNMDPSVITNTTRVVTDSHLNDIILSQPSTEIITSNTQRDSNPSQVLSASNLLSRVSDPKSQIRLVRCGQSPHKLRFISAKSGANQSVPISPTTHPILSIQAAATSQSSFVETHTSQIKPSSPSFPVTSAPSLPVTTTSPYLNISSIEWSPSSNNLDCIKPLDYDQDAEFQFSSTNESFSDISENMELSMQPENGDVEQNPFLYTEKPHVYYEITDMNSLAPNTRRYHGLTGARGKKSLPNPPTNKFNKTVTLPSVTRMQLLPVRSSRSANRVTSNFPTNNDEKTEQTQLMTDDNMSFTPIFQLKENDIDAFLDNYKPGSNTGDVDNTIDCQEESIIDNFPWEDVAASETIGADSPSGNRIPEQCTEELLGDLFDGSPNLVDSMAEQAPLPLFSSPNYSSLTSPKRRRRDQLLTPTDSSLPSPLYLTFPQLESFENADEDGKHPNLLLDDLFIDPETLSSKTISPSSLTEH